MTEARCVETDCNGIAVYCAHVNDRWPPMLTVFPDIDRAGLPDDIAILALANLGDDATIHHSDW